MRMIRLGDEMMNMRMVLYNSLSNVRGRMPWSSMVRKYGSIKFIRFDRLPVLKLLSGLEAKLLLHNFFILIIRGCGRHLFLWIIRHFYTYIWKRLNFTNTLLHMVAIAQRLTTQEFAAKLTQSSITGSQWPTPPKFTFRRDDSNDKDNFYTPFMDNFMFHELKRLSRMSRSVSLV